jgi:hypothetical protein
MGNLFKLKEWLTIPEAAKHLAVLFGEKVAKSDVLRLALDGHLKLSVNFVNETLANTGKIVPISEARVSEEFTITDALRKSFAEQSGVAGSVVENSLADTPPNFFAVFGVNQRPIVSSCQRPNLSSLSGRFD